MLHHMPNTGSKVMDAAFRQQEARYASGWYDSITSDTFG